ncbi:hypothetical protein [Leuconostoc carnosum]|uniref:hypothetical protein n=1 Tax=Leuconostoc carnosum TaxID=1252 RepID=UPI0038839230
MSEGIKPAAYMYRDFDNKDDDCRPSLQFNEPSPTWDIIEELYTKEQLQPIVKMTQAEFDEFHDLFEKDFDLYSAITEIADTNLRITLYDRLFTGTSTDKEKQNEFSALWASYNPLEPEETIEIVPTMKWFVRSKEPDSDGDFQFLNGIDEPNDWGYSHNEEDTNNPRNIAYPFDTKERAEEWKNPITEVVLLPIGDE